MLEFEQKHNKEREKNSKRVVCFTCNKERQTTQTCFKLFPNGKEQGGQHDRQSRPRNNLYIGKKNVKSRIITLAMILQ